MKLEDRNKKTSKSFQAVFDNLNNYEACNIGDVREKLGLKQVEFAKMTGSTSALISEVEHGKKLLTNETASKIADTLNELMNKPGESDYFIDPVVLSASHLASFYSQELQPHIMKLWLEIDAKKWELEYALKNKTLPSDVKKKEFVKRKNLQIMSTVNERRAIIQENIDVFREREKPKKQEFSGPSLMPKF